MNKKILVFGGSGFLGLMLLKHLVNAGVKNVICLDLNNPNLESVKFIRFDLINDDIYSLKDFENSLIINLTGQVTNPSNICYLLNSRGVQKLTAIANHFNSFLIQISTVGVFGSTKIANEESEINPETVYSTCKAFAEYEIKSSLSENQFAIIRLSNLYGFNQEKGIMAYLKRSYLSDRKLFFNNDGSLKRAFLNVEDCARILTEAITMKTSLLRSAYNFIGNDVFTIKELVNKFEEISGISFNAHYNPSLPYDNALTLSGERWDDLVGNNYKHSVSDFIKKLCND
jgi:nucleoside-diphosphate-sugar epimerase